MQDAKLMQPKIFTRLQHNHVCFHQTSHLSHPKFGQAKTEPNAPRQSISARATDATELQTSSFSQNGVHQPGLIFSPRPGSVWDSGAVSNPVVRYFRTDEEERWMMWYNGYDVEGSQAVPAIPRIGVAVSQDGIHWERGSQSSASIRPQNEAGKVLGPNEDWWWHDTRHTSVGDVQMSSSDSVNKGEGVYWMYYSGGSFEEAKVPEEMPGLTSQKPLEGLRTRIGLALSQDGYNFARIEADHHTGALMDAGDENEWDQTCNTNPQVLSFGLTDRKMYYSAYDPSRKKWLVGLATSKDGFVWRKQGPIFEGRLNDDFDALGASSHHIVRDIDSKRFVMFYEAVAPDNTRSISLAVSKDGVKNWKRLGKPILVGEKEDGWDSGGVGSPCPVSMAGGRWRLYYTGWNRNSSESSIGLAITNQDDEETFEGVRTAFKRRMS